MTDKMPVTVAIPTYGRGRMLCDTIDGLLALDSRPSEILVVDQTPRHDEEVEQRLCAWDSQGVVRWLRIEEQSITRAANTALREATSPVVLFVDDDISPEPGLVDAHGKAYGESADTWAVAGQVVQPEQRRARVARSVPRDGLSHSLDFSFRSPERMWVRSAMAGNFSVRRERALEIGGFDENFVGAAFRFETEFCRRLWRYGGKVLYEPTARVHHLRAVTGGIRRHGSHLHSASPAHGVGDYYFALREGAGMERFLYILKRPFREICTRFHVSHPWWIPAKFVGETRALLWALSLYRKGPSCLETENGTL